MKRREVYKFNIYNQKFSDIKKLKSVNAFQKTGKKNIFRKNQRAGTITASSCKSEWTICNFVLRHGTRHESQPSEHEQEQLMSFEDKILRRILEPA